jgi:hypothetical protein
MAPFNAPAVLPHANPVPARCNDWRFHNRFAYTNPCSSRENYRIDFSATYADDCLHGSRTPQAQRNDFDQRLCAERGQGTHPTRGNPQSGIHSICRYCIAATESLPWFKQAQAYFVAKQPHDSHSNVSRHFLTRLCRLCEEREMILLNQRDDDDDENAIPPPPAPTAAQQNAMVDYPLNTCICKKAALDDGLRCKKHRRARYAAVMPRLNAQRVANREWLRRVELDANGVTVRRTDPDEMRQLDIRREGNRRPGRPQRPQLMRACRCGADSIDDVRRAQVLLCMSCEGIVHVHQPELPPLPLDPNTAPHLLLMNSHTTPHMFRLRRF